MFSVHFCLSLHFSDACAGVGGFWDQGDHLELVVLAHQRAGFKVQAAQPGGSLPGFLTDGGKATSWNWIMKMLKKSKLCLLAAELFIFNIFNEQQNNITSITSLPVITFHHSQ